MIHLANFDSTRISSALATLLVVAATTLFAFGCGTPAPTDTEADELDEDERQMLCEELQEIGSCTVTEEDENYEATMNFDAPDDCDEYSDSLMELDDDCPATYGDFIDCHENCASEEAACNRVIECYFAGLG